MAAILHVPILLGSLQKEELADLECHWLESDQITLCRPTTMHGIWNELIGWGPLELMREE